MIFKEFGDLKVETRRTLQIYWTLLFSILVAMLVYWRIIWIQQIWNKYDWYPPVINHSIGKSANCLIQTSIQFGDFPASHRRKPGSFCFRCDICFVNLSQLLSREKNVKWWYTVHMNIWKHVCYLPAKSPLLSRLDLGALRNAERKRAWRFLNRGGSTHEPEDKLHPWRFLMLLNWHPWRKILTQS